MYYLFICLNYYSRAISKIYDLSKQLSFNDVNYIEKINAQ